MTDEIDRALVRRIVDLETGLRNIAGIAAQFDADADFRAIQDIAEYLLGAVESVGKEER
jgi:hypothetical protein